MTHQISRGYPVNVTMRAEDDGEPILLTGGLQNIEDDGVTQTITILLEDGQEMVISNKSTGQKFEVID
jgi:hypothetical protein